MKLFLIAFALGNYFATQAQHIIFTRQVNNNDNLMIMDENREIKILTNHSRKDSSPMISPDGKMLVFTSERVGWWKIWTMNLETNEFKQLTNSGSADYSPSWSPDGQQIVFTSSRDGNQEVYTIDKHGKNLRNITKSKDADITPHWAADGYIYYSSNISGTYQIARIKPDGTGRQQITRSNGNKLMPQISNDQKQILYYGDEDGNLEIYLMQVGDSTSKRLTNHPLKDMRPRWSPDNKKIVFERGNKGNNHHIYTMNSDGTGIKQITFKNYNYAPSFVATK